jgi:hypothetical protein
MEMRKWIVASAAIAILGSAPAVTLAASRSGGGSSPTNCQTTRWTTSAVSATPTFTRIRALTTNVTAIYPVTVTVSGVVKGQPVAFKVVDHWIQTQTARPGNVRVRPVGGAATAFSFTWVAPGSSAATRGHRFDIDWRRVSVGGTSTLVKADVAVSYTTDACRPAG